MSMGPIYFNHRIDGSGGYQEYEIDNVSLTARRYKIKVIPHTNNIKLKNKMNKWIDVYPKILTVPPKSSKKFKVLITADKNTRPGEYEFVLTPTPVVIPVLEKKKSDSKLAIISTKTVLHFSMVINSYVGNLGDIKKDLVISELKTKDGIKIKIKNKMKREVALDIMVTDKDKRKRDLLKVKKGQTIEKKFNYAKKIEIKDAPTEEEIIVIK